MDYHVDIQIRPDPEFPPEQLMMALFAKLHRALVARGTGDIGVSFPRHDERRRSLGSTLRLHATRRVLEDHMQSGWLEGIRDHVDCTEPEPVPTNVEYRCVIRQQVKSSPERLMRRHMRRKGVGIEQVREYFSRMEPRELQLPSLEVRSQSTGQSFRLFVKHVPVEASDDSEPFNAYGLSAKSTVPWF